MLVVVYTRDGKVLLLRRVDHSSFWQSVTGSLKWDEAPRQAAQRELREETGLEAGKELQDWEKIYRYPILPQWRYRYAPNVAENTEHVFSLELITEMAIHVNPSEHAGYVWLDFQAAVRRVTSWTNREAILALTAQQ